MEYFWVGIGGLIGANARFAMTRFIAGHAGEAWPWGTFGVNVAGAFLIGVVLTWLTDRGMPDSTARLLLVTGFLGGYTTFSSYTWEALALVERGKWAGAAAYLLGSNAVAILACLAGIALARLLR